MFKHLISSKQFTNIHELKRIFDRAEILEKQDRKGKLHKSCQNKILACLFYEPSTRTRFSFEAAMLKLGGQVISSENAAKFSSAIKGETLPDTIRVVSQYADIIVIRHYKEGSAQIASQFSEVPIINAGDGAGEHPTQALLDLYTIRQELKRIDSLKIALVGDLLNSRVIHSLCQLFSLYKNTEIYLVSPNQLRLSLKIKNNLKQKNVKLTEIKAFRDILNKIDVLYLTRIQKERFANLREYRRLKNSYHVDIGTLKNLNKHAIILHPLPRVAELNSNVDQDKRAAYFRQVKNGLYLRMALLEMLLT